MKEEEEMKKKEKLCSIALASTFIIFFLVLISSMASASIGKDPHTITPPSITREQGIPPMTELCLINSLQKDMI